MCCVPPLDSRCCIPVGVDKSTYGWLHSWLKAFSAAAYEARIHGLLDGHH